MISCPNSKVALSVTMWLMTEPLRPTDELESLIQNKEPRLPKGTRTYIRRLKQAGKLDEALRVTQEHRQKKMPIYNVEKRLTVAVGNILITQSSLETAQEAAMATWLLYRENEFTSGERITELKELSKLNPDLEPELADTAAQIRDEAMRLNLN